MEMSSYDYGRLDPTDRGNFVNPLRLPGPDGPLAFLDASDTPGDLEVGNAGFEAATPSL